MSRHVDRLLRQRIEQELRATVDDREALTRVALLLRRHSGGVLDELDEIEYQVREGFGGQRGA